jgi:hypothetical protein
MTGVGRDLRRHKVRWEAEAEQKSKKKSPFDCVLHLEETPFLAGSSNRRTAVSAGGLPTIGTVNSSMISLSKRGACPVPDWKPLESQHLSNQLKAEVYFFDRMTYPKRQP